MHNLKTSEYDSVWDSSSDSSSDTGTRRESEPPVAPYLPFGNPAERSPPHVLAAVEAIGHHMDRTGLFQEQFDMDSDMERRTNRNTAEYFPRDLRNTNVDSSTRRESTPPARAPAAPYLPPGCGKWNTAKYIPRVLRNTNVDSLTRRESAPPATPYLPLGYHAPSTPNVLSQVAVEATDREKIGHFMDRTGFIHEQPDMERRTNWNTAEYMIPQDLRNTNVDSSTRRESAPPARALAAPYLPLGCRKWNTAEYIPRVMRNTNVDSSTRRESAPPRAPDLPLRHPETPVPNVLNQVAVEDIDKEKIWLFMDTTGLVPQGPFAMETLRKLLKARFLPQNLRIWKRTQDQKESVFLNDAIAERSQKEIEPFGSSSCSQVVKTYAQVVRINPISASLPDAQPVPTSSNLPFDDTLQPRIEGRTGSYQVDR